MVPLFYRQRDITSFVLILIQLYWNIFVVNALNVYTPILTPPLTDCNHSPPPTDVCLTPTPTQVVATQTSPEQVLETQPTNPVAPSVEAPPVCVKKPSLATNEQREATPWTKGKKRQARPSIVHHASACANNNATVDPNNSSMSDPNLTILELFACFV